MEKLNYEETMQCLNDLKEEKKWKKEKKEDESPELSQGQDFCVEIQIKLLEAESDGKDEVTYDGSNTFLKFSILRGAALAEKIL